MAQTALPPGVPDTWRGLPRAGLGAGSPPPDDRAGGPASTAAGQRILGAQTPPPIRGRRAAPPPRPRRPTPGWVLAASGQDRQPADAGNRGPGERLRGRGSGELEAEPQPRGVRGALRGHAGRRLGLLTGHRGPPGRVTVICPRLTPLDPQAAQRFRHWWLGQETTGPRAVRAPNPVPAHARGPPAPRPGRVSRTRGSAHAAGGLGGGRPRPAPSPAPAGPAESTVQTLVLAAAGLSSGCHGNGLQREADAVQEL